MTQLRSHPRLIRKLQEALGDQLCVALDDNSVVEIMLNPDGKLFIERLGHGVAPAGEMTSATAEIVIGSVAHALHSEADDERPIISGELPIGGHRFEGLLPPVVKAPVFAIRRRASRLIPLDEYVRDKVMTRRQADIVRNASPRGSTSSSPAVRARVRPLWPTPSSRRSPRRLPTIAS